MSSTHSNAARVLLPKLYKIEVTNPRTNATVTFLGQGVRVAEAIKDGLGNLGSKVSVRLPSGAQRVSALKDFEEDVEFGEAGIE